MKAQIAKQLFAGKFEIQGEIAKGQTGTILYGYDIGLRQEVAIKVYHSHINGRLVRGKTFIEKSKPLLLIDHPNLIKIFNVEEQDDNPVVFMEFFDAPSLHQLIHDKGVLSVPDMLLLAREITEVFIHTHFQGIIHGTLHPGHVLVGPNGQVKVMDLGLSWILMDILHNCEPELFRPLPYFPPEIAKGEPLNISSDLYCLGFMMYEMLTGTVPYAGLPKTSIMGKLAFDQTDPTFNFPETVPEAVCDLIRDMSRNKAQDRIQDATHVLTIINQQLAKFTQDEKPPSPQPVETTATSQAQTAPPTVPPADSPEPTSPQTSTPAPSNSPTTEKPPLKKAPLVQRPKSAVDYGQVQKAERLRKFGIAMTCVVLLGVAGSLGYWYRDYIETHLPSFPLQVESASPAKGSPRNTPIETHETSAPTDERLLNHESQVGEEEPIHKELLPPASKHTDQNEMSSSKPLPPTDESEPNRLKGADAGKVPQEQPGTSLLPTKKQPISVPLSTSDQKMPGARIPTHSTVTTPTPGKDTKNIPLQQPATTKPPRRKSVAPAMKRSTPKKAPSPAQQQPPARTSEPTGLVTPPPEQGAKNIPPRQPATTPAPLPQSAAPATKPASPKEAAPTVQQQPPAKTPVASELVPPTSDKSTKDILLQEPTPPKSPPQQSVEPTTKAPITKPTPPPVQQQVPASSPPASDAITPPITKPLTDETPKTPASIEPPTETTSQKTKSTTSTPPAADRTPKPLIEGSKEILESPNLSSADSFSISTP